jgi:hypothetical protein
VYKLTYELVTNDRREARAILLPPSMALGHALNEAALVMTADPVRLHTLTLEQLYPSGERRLLLLRYERDGL